MATSSRSAGHAAALLTILIWGTTYIATKKLLADFNSMEILFFRFIIGYLSHLIVYPHRVRTNGVREELHYIAAGLCGVTLFFLLENIALTYTLASNVGVIVSIAPFFTAVLAHYILEGEPLRPRFFVGFVIATTGIVLIICNGSFLLQLNPLGDMLAILASMVWAVYSVLMRKISQFGHHTVGSTRKVFFYGLLLMIPALFVFDIRLDVMRFANISNLLNMAFLGFAASALCFVTWNWAVGVLGAVKTSLYIYLVPLITIVAAALLLHENITWIALLGASLTIVGLVLLDGQQFRWKQKGNRKASQRHSQSQVEGS